MGSLRRTTHCLLVRSSGGFRGLGFGGLGFRVVLWRGPQLEKWLLYGNVGFGEACQNLGLRP